MQTNVLGYPRIGSQRELKKACEAYWAGKMSLEKLQLTARQLRRQHWETLQQAGIDLILPMIFHCTTRCWICA